MRLYDTNVQEFTQVYSIKDGAAGWKNSEPASSVQGLRQEQGGHSLQKAYEEGGYLSHNP